MTGDNEAEITSLKTYRDLNFKIKDLGTTRYFLGMKILPTTNGLVLTQRKFAKELLAEFADSEAVSVVCLLEYNHRLAADQGDLFENPSLYRKIVGKLNFLANTRPDLAFAVQYLSQFMQQPRVPHFQAVQHVLRYLKGQPDLGILLSKDSQYTL